MKCLFFKSKMWCGFLCGELVVTMFRMAFYPLNVKDYGVQEIRIVCIQYVSHRPIIFVVFKVFFDLEEKYIEKHHTHQLCFSPLFITSCLCQYISMLLQPKWLTMHAHPGYFKGVVHPKLKIRPRSCLLTNLHCVWEQWPLAIAPEYLITLASEQVRLMRSLNIYCK